MIARCSASYLARCLARFSPRRLAGALAFAFTVSALGCHSLLGVEPLPEPCRADWWDCRYPARIQMTLDNTEQSQDLIDFPVLIRFDSTEQGDFNGDGSDLVFVADDQQTVLAHEIDRWDRAGNSWVWVRVPLIRASSDEGAIFLYYGHTDEFYRRDPKEVWADNFEVVLHFNNFFDDQGVVNDSSRNNRLATVEGSPERVNGGRIGWGVEFDGDLGDYIALEPLLELEPTPGDPKTLEVWVKTDAPQESAIFYKENACRGWSLALDGDLRLHGRIARAGDVCMGTQQASEVSVQPIHEGLWHYAVVVAQNDPATTTQLDLSMYWRDMDVNSHIVTSRREDIVDNSLFNHVGYIGANYAQEKPFVGTLDELRISSGVRSAEWIAAQHASMSGAMTLIREVQQRDVP